MVYINLFIWGMKESSISRRSMDKAVRSGIVKIEIPNFMIISLKNLTCKKLDNSFKLRDDYGLILYLVMNTSKKLMKI